MYYITGKWLHMGGLVATGFLRMMLEAHRDYVLLDVQGPLRNEHYHI